MNFISSVSVETRKEHFCWGCARKFPKGSQLERITSSDGSEINSSYWCATCSQYWREHMSSGETIDFGDLRDNGRDAEWEKIRKEMEEPQ